MMRTMNGRVGAVILAVALLALGVPTPGAAASKPSKSAKGAPATRTEHDLLGAKEIPASAYYGVQTARGLFSTLCSYYPRQGTAAMKTRYAQDYLCLPSLLRRHG